MEEVVVVEEGSYICLPATDSLCAVVANRGGRAGAAEEALLSYGYTHTRETTY